MTVSATDAPAAVRDVAALAGPHNAVNAAAAAACLRGLGFADEQTEAAMAGFAGLAHRLQPVTRHGPITFVNDLKATNGVAAACALAAYDSIYWIAGGEAKEDGLGPAAAATANVERAYLIGSAAPDFAQTLGPLPDHACRRSRDRDSRRLSDAAAATPADGSATIPCRRPPPPSTSSQASSARGEAFCAIAHRLAGLQGGAHADRTDRSLVGVWWWTVDRWLLASALLLMVVGALLVMAAGPAVATSSTCRRSISACARESSDPGRRHHAACLASRTAPDPGAGAARACRHHRADGAAVVAGSEIKGATRWINIAGFNLQPSEFAKPLFAVVSAWL